MALVDDQRRVLGRAPVGVDVTGYTEVVKLITEYGGSRKDTPIAIGTDNRDLQVAAQQLQQALQSHDRRPAWRRHLR